MIYLQFSTVVRKNLITNEIDNFKKLDRQARKLLISTAFFLAAFPLINLFINAYLWRSGESIDFIYVYNLFYFVGLPVGFILNGYVLRFVSIKKLYFIGAILQGVVALLVVFVSEPSTSTLGFYGLLFGLGSGFFWGNSNYIQQVLTNSDNRLFYMSLESIAYMLLNILSPLFAGLIISFGPTSGLYSLQTGYRVVMTIAMAFLLMSGLNILKVKIKELNYPKLLIKNKSKYWNFNRLYVFINDIFLGLIMVLPSILILEYAGNEGVLGNLQALGAFLAAVVIYLIGRRFNSKHYFRLILIAWLLFLFSSIPMMFELNAITVAIFLLTVTVAQEIRYIVTWPLSMDLIDELSENAQTLKYAFITDNEIFFNLGRIVGVNIFLLVWVASSEQFALRVVAFGILMIQPIGLLAGKKILDRHHKVLI